MSTPQDEADAKPPRKAKKLKLPAPAATPAAPSALPALPAGLTSPNSKANPKKGTKISFARARKRLIQRYGYKEDELDVSFKTEAELLEFYEKTLRKGLNAEDLEAEKEAGWDKEDDFDLSPEDKTQLAREKDNSRLAAAANIDQSSVPASARLTPEELAESNKSIEDLLKSADDI